MIFDEIDSDGNGSYLKVAAPEKANNVKMDRIPWTENPFLKMQDI